MLNKKLIVCTWILLFACINPALLYAQSEQDLLGQTIQINTRLHSFAGRPSWLIVIRDIDHNQNIPYLFDFTRGNNFWMAFTYGRHYLITISNLQFSPFRHNPFRNRRTNNFCHLESHGRIIHNESIVITLTGDLSPNTNSYSCHVVRFPESNFTIVKPDTLTP